MKLCVDGVNFMIIQNRSEKNIKCDFGDREVMLSPQESIRCGELSDCVRFSVAEKNYSVLQSRDSKLLKFLSAIDDPFRLKKEYHLMVEASFTKEKLAGCDCIILTARSYYADTDTGTYYDYVGVEAGGALLSADEMCLLPTEEIKKDFADNNRRLIGWQLAWDIFIEPIVLEVIGYWVIFKLFSIWFGTGALFIVLSIIVLNIIFDGILFWFKRKRMSKRCERFIELCSDDAAADSLK